MRPSSNSGTRVLVAFDFDHTVVDANSDTWIYKALPSGQLPPEVKRQYVAGQWTAFMNVVFQHLAAEGVKEQRIVQTMKEVPLTHGMQELLSYLQSHSAATFDCVIISDSNTLFIDWILDAHNMRPHFKQVFTNPASWSAEGVLQVWPHHQHSCSSCNANMCKRAVLQGLLEAQHQLGIGYRQLLYVGDGANDLCPSTLLSPGDAVFPREGYAMHKALLQSRQAMQLARGTPDTHNGKDHAGIVAEIVEWDSALSILDWVKCNVPV